MGNKCKKMKALLLLCLLVPLISTQEILFSKDVKGLECFEYVGHVFESKDTIMAGDKSAIENVKASICRKFPDQCADFNSKISLVTVLLENEFEVDDVCPSSIRCPAWRCLTR